MQEMINTNNKYRRLDSNKKIAKLIAETIPEEIMDQAIKSSFNLEKCLMSLVFDHHDTWFQREGINSTVRGVVGNVLANRYFTSRGYTVENEVPIYDRRHKKISASDIVLTSPQQHKTFIELKTTKAIILDEKDYPFDDDYSFGFGEYIPRELIVFDHEYSLPKLSALCGIKAVEQLRRTREYINLNNMEDTADVKLCVFEGTFISDDAMQELSKYGEVIRIPKKLETIFDYSNLLVEKIMTEGREIIQPTKGREPKIISIPELEL